MSALHTALLLLTLTPAVLPAQTWVNDTVSLRLAWGAATQEYAIGYVANHWCAKGHILLCLEGTLHTELADGRSFVLTPGMSYQVADDTAPHRSSALAGARLFIVD